MRSVGLGMGLGWLLACGGVLPTDAVAPEPNPPPEEAPLSAPTLESVAAQFPGSKIEAHCEMEFSASGQLAVGMRRKGRSAYVIVGADTVIHIGKGTPTEAHISCFTAAEARDFGGRIQPVGSGDVLCIFVEETEAECYQDDGRGGVVKVGGWIT